MQHHRLQDPALESRLPGLFDVMADAAPDDPAIGDAVLGRARRRRARRLAGGVAGTATGVAAAVAVAVGGVPALPVLGTGGSSSQAAGQVAADRAPARGGVVGPYEITVLPKGLAYLKRAGDPEVGTFKDPVDTSLVFAFTARDFTEGGRELSSGESRTARQLTVLASEPAKGGPAAAQRAFARDLDRERKKLKPGETLVADTLLGRPAYRLTRTGKRIDLFVGPDAKTGKAVNVAGRNLTVAEIRAVADGLRLVPGAPPISEPTPTPSRTLDPITSGVVPVAESAWPRLEPQHPPLEVHQAVLDVYRAPADDAFRNPQHEYQWVVTTAGALKRQVGNETAFEGLEDDDPVYVAQVPKASSDGRKVPVPAAGTFVRALIPLPKGTSRVTETWIGPSRPSDPWLDLSSLGTAHRASAGFRP